MDNQEVKLNCKRCNEQIRLLNIKGKYIPFELEGHLTHSCPVTNPKFKVGDIVTYTTKGLVGGFKIFRIDSIEGNKRYLVSKGHYTHRVNDVVFYPNGQFYSIAYFDKEAKEANLEMYKSLYL